MNASLGRRVGRTVGLLVAAALGFAGVIFVLLLLGEDGIRSTLAALLFGWFRFGVRTLPQVAANCSAIGFAALCTGLILALLHPFCAWLYASLQRAPTRRVWKLRWTLSLFAGLCLLFGFVMGATGVAHQVGWLVSSDAPFLVSKGFGEKTRFFSNARQVELAARISEWDPAETRALLAGEELRMIERYHVLLFPDEVGKVAGIIVFPRVVADREKLGVFVFDRSTVDADDEAQNRGDFHPAAELPAWIARFTARSQPAPPRTGER